MPTAVGPNTKGEENLVFGYDLGDVSNSYRGEPTVNLLYSAGSYNLIDGATDIYSNVTKTDLGNGKYRFVNDGTGVTTIRVYTNEADLIDGETYAVSVYYEDLIGTISIDWCDQTVSGNNSSTETSGRLSGTASRSSYTDPFYFLDINLTNGGAATIYNPQVEYKSHVTPFVAGTRSATQGLIDLTGNSTIDLTNVSFDSNAQMTFDGTNDNIKNLSNGISSIQYCTVSLWMKDSVSTVAHRGPFWISDSSSRMLFIDIRSDYNHLQINTETKTNNRKASSNQSSLVNGQWHNVVITRNDTVLSAYIDGVAISLTQNDGYGSWGIAANDLSIGAFLENGSLYSYWAGSIDKFQIYSRVLTASEIKANYNALKGRFNI